MNFDYDLLVHSPAQEARLPNSIAAFTIGLQRGPVLCAYAEGKEAGIASQIAVKLAKDTIVREMLSSEDENRSKDWNAPSLVESAFRSANQAVFDYGHRMFARGKVSATSWIAAYDGDNFVVGRVGHAQSWLCRDGRVQKFFLDTPEDGKVRRLGENLQVLVDLGSVTVKRNDVFVVWCGTNSNEMDEMESNLQKLKCETLHTQQIAEELTRMSSESSANPLLVLRVGAPPIQLREVVFEDFSK